MYSNYGEICLKIKGLMEDFQKRSQSNTKVETIADMKVCLFFFNFKKYEKMFKIVFKHLIK